jgi:DNA-binding MurR/RpiR family transcriptional regulator
MTVIDRIMIHADRLTATERKVAAILAEEPQVIAFGTVAQVAQRAGTSGPSVVRLAVKLGYDGFVGLQADVQSELAQQLGPARERIRQQPPNDLVSQVEATEQDNVAVTLHNLSREALERAAVALSDLHHRIWVYPGELTAPIGQVLATFLGQLRPGVTLLAGSDMTVGRALTDLRPGDPMLAIDIHRYERSLVSMVDWARDRGARLIAVTDSPLSPLARQAAETFFMSARGVGPFDSVVGGVALANVLVSAVAAKMRETAAGRLDSIEAAWADWKALVVDPGLTGADGVGTQADVLVIPEEVSPGLGVEAGEAVGPRVDGANGTG